MIIGLDAVSVAVWGNDYKREPGGRGEQSRRHKLHVNIEHLARDGNPDSFWFWLESTAALESQLSHSISLQARQ